MRIFGSEKLDSVLKTLGLSDGEHPTSLDNKSIERAQKKSKLGTLKSGKVFFVLMMQLTNKEK